MGAAFVRYSPPHLSERAPTFGGEGAGRGDKAERSEAQHLPLLTRSRNQSGASLVKHRDKRIRLARGPAQACIGRRRRCARRGFAVAASEGESGLERLLRNGGGLCRLCGKPRPGLYARSAKHRRRGARCLPRPRDERERAVARALRQKSCLRGPPDLRSSKPMSCCDRQAASFSQAPCPKGGGPNPHSQRNTSGAGNRESPSSREPCAQPKRKCRESRAKPSLAGRERTREHDEKGGGLAPEKIAGDPRKAKAPQRDSLQRMQEAQTQGVEMGDHSPNHEAAGVPPFGKLIMGEPTLVLRKIARDCGD